MLRSRKTIDEGATRAKLEARAAAVRRETEGAEADPFDLAMMAAVLGVADLVAGQAGELAELEVRLHRLGRQVPG